MKNEESAWYSIADLLDKKIPVAKLATAIETEGVQTYDRFGRRIFVNDEDKNSKVIKGKVLDLLESYYSIFDLEDMLPGVSNLSNSSELRYSLQKYGWLKDDLPKFDKNTL